MKMLRKYAYVRPQKATFSEQLREDRLDPNVRPKILFLEMFNVMVQTAGGVVIGPTRSVDLCTGAVDYRVHYATPAGDRLDCEARDREIVFWFRKRAAIPPGYDPTLPLLHLHAQGGGVMGVIPCHREAGAERFAKAVYGWLRQHVPLDWDRPMDKRYTWTP